MRIAISNLAWDPDEDDAIAALLAAQGIDAIDVAPGKYFPDPATTTAGDVECVRRAWEARGMDVTGMQALLFGTQGLNLFGTQDVREVMLAHLRAVCRIGAGLGARHLVFGSPRNRDRSGLDDAATEAVARDFFLRLGDIAASHGVCICLEPNPPRYGANFMTDSASTAAIVRTVDHPAIRMQCDTGAMAINGEDPAIVIASHASLIAHAHASEPGLVPLGDAGTDHAPYAQALASHRPDVVVCIEMLATADEPHAGAVARAVGVAVSHYAEPRA